MIMPVAINEVPIACINQAAVTYHVPATLILAIMRQENGRNGQKVPSKNGSYDLGVMQINTRWLPTLASYGYTLEDIQFDSCKNIMAGTWILSRGIAEGQSAWQGVGNYNSHTPKFNKRYRENVYHYFRKINLAITV